MFCIILYLEKRILHLRYIVHSPTPLIPELIHGVFIIPYVIVYVFIFLKGAVPLETAALNRRRRSYAMYLFLVVCSMYAYFVVAVETDTNRQLL